MTNDKDVGADRRVEARVAAGDKGLLTVTSSPKPVEVRIIDVSRSGLQIEVDNAIEPASPVQIKLGNVTVMGKVERCSQIAGGRYRVGVATGEMIEPGRG